MWWATLALAAGCALGGAPAGAQVVPNARWRTLRTPHFRVHFTPPLEEQARRAAASAEAAYAGLAAELVPPRGPVDLVIADNVDYSNGYATVVPTPRIVVYAHPPVEGQTLRFYDDWNALVITHELTHVFHLDRARGIWRVAQRVFGRNPVLFPNSYAPSWLVEALAVYYESRLTGYGRLAGTQHRLFARSSAAAGAVPRLDELSLATPRFPGGTAAYAYGSLLLDYMARERGAEHVGRFVERTSGALIPYRLDRAARRSFGIGFEGAWRQWRDSLLRGSAARPSPGAPLPGWRELTREGWYAEYPRWLDSATIVYPANTGREVPGVYRLDTTGRRQRVGRRNNLEPNVPLDPACNAGCPLLFGQLDYVGPYEVRSDLYVQRGGRERRLTRGARLSHPDARADGAIVALQAVPSSTRLVRVTADGRAITPLTAASPDTQWAEPRWSPAGDRVAAVRRTREGRAAVVVLDTLGRVVREVSGSRAVEQTPSWSPDGARIYFVSDRSGTAEVYVAELGTPSSTRSSAGTDDGSPPAGPTGAVRVARLSDAVAGIFYPAPSPDGAVLAAIQLRADGFHLGVAPVRAARGAPVPPFADTARAAPAPVRRDGSAARPYSPWRTLLPRYWTPLLGSAGQGSAQLGALTSGADVIGRHAYVAQALVETRGAGARREVTLAGTYRYAGLGLPLVDLGASQSYEHFTLRDQRGGNLCCLAERGRTATAALTLLRPRFRTAASAAVGAELEQYDYEGAPTSLLDRAPPFYRSRPSYRAIFLTGGWSNVQRPALAISPEDGMSLSASTRRRWRNGATGARSHTVVAVARGYKSLDLGGFAHHVLAARLAGGWAEGREASAFSAGGTGGTSIEVVPGYSVGDRQRTFFVRGFAPGARRGTRALGGSVEYRAPLLLPARGYRLLPVFLSRASASAFGDAAQAWCAAPAAARTCSGAAGVSRTIASAGLELNVDAAPQFDVPYRFRLGLAAPVAGAEGARPVSAYFTVGLAF